LQGTVVGKTCFTLATRTGLRPPLAVGGCLESLVGPRLVSRGNGESQDPEGFED
jgi:hypothetical protein